MILPPAALAYTVVMVITNMSVAIQLAILVPVLGLIFVLLQMLRDPAVKPTEMDRRILFPSLLSVFIVGTALGIAIILVVHISPDIHRVIPDHNLVASWEIDFEELGYSREEALERVNLGYLWHAIFSMAYVTLVPGGRLFWAIYRTEGIGDPVVDADRSDVPGGQEVVSA